MDRQIANEVRYKRIARRVAIAGGTIVAVVGALVLIVGWLSPSIYEKDVQIAEVTRGPVDATVQASGIIVPDVEQVVSSPVEARVLRINHRPGDRVHAGDELLTLDNLTTRLELERNQELLARKESEATQLRLENDDSLAALAADLEAKKLDGEILRMKAEQSSRLRSEGLTAAQDALMAETEAKKNAIEIARLEQRIGRARRTAGAKVAAVSLETAMLRKERNESQRQVELSMMRADRDGIVTSIVQDVGATIRRGDVLARIADLSAFRVTATVADMYVPRLAAGMPVKVKVDDATTVAGTLSSIDPRIENGVARFNVTLDRDAHARLRNNLRVDVFVVVGRNNGVLRVRRGALGQAPSENVFVVRGERIVRMPVKFGLAGQDEIEIVSGLREGDRVVISNMNDFDGLKEMRLK